MSHETPPFQRIEDEGYYTLHRVVVQEPLLMQAYSVVMPAALVIFALRTSSSLMSRANSSGLPGSGSPPCAISAALVSGILSADVTAALMRLTMSLRVPAATRIPYHDCT